MIWSDHIDDICKRSNKRLDIVSKIRYLLPRLCIEERYNSSVRFLLDYSALTMTIALISTGHLNCVKIYCSTIFRSWENYLIIFISYF